jgi:hypothetical protein
MQDIYFDARLIKEADGMLAFEHQGKALCLPAYPPYPGSNSQKPGTVGVVRYVPALGNAPALQDYLERAYGVWRKNNS